MRTQEQFDAIWKDLKWFVNHHSKPVWLVPQEVGYCLSVVKPQVFELPIGTSAVLYGLNFEFLDYINSENGEE